MSRWVAGAAASVERTPSRPYDFSPVHAQTANISRSIANRPPLSLSSAVSAWHDRRVNSALFRSNYERLNLLIKHIDPDTDITLFSIITTIYLPNESDIPS